MKIVMPICLLSFLIFSCSENVSKKHSAQKTHEEILELKLKPYDDESFKLFGNAPTSQNILAYKQTIEDELYGIKTRTQLFKGDWTIQGPGNIGGRVNAVASHPTNSNIMFAGFARGGLWKTTNSGLDWKPLWDKKLTQAVSTIVFDPNNTNIMYAGTGDVNISGNVYVGDGIYKSLDGGETWNYIGLKETYVIGDILVNPENSNEIVVATMGLPFEETQDRGIYYSNDGGTTWEQTLFTSANSGFHDFAYNSNNPNVILAGGWTRFRNGNKSIISGPDSKVYRSVDFGKTWDIADIEIPDTIGRSAVTFSQLDPNIAYAAFIGTDSDYHSLHKSTDAGATWVKINDRIENDAPNMVGGFGWFFGRIAYLVDPSTNEETLFLCGVDLWKYDEEIAEWSRATPPWWTYEVHADKHAIDLNADGEILLGTDGGMYKYDGISWSDIENIPNNMFYRTEFNPHEGNVYFGGMQDNGSSGGNASTINEWERIWGGDGFQMRFHPTNSGEYYVETQNGNIAYIFNDGYDFVGVDLGEADSDRKNWDMQYILSPHDPSVIYTGTSRAVRITNDNGVFDPIVISAEMTDEPEFISHTISALDESFIEEDLLYYGTTDGNVWVFENGDFELINNGLPDIYVTSIKASPNLVDNVYVTLSNYKFNDHSPRIYRSKDRGKTWEGISGNLPEGAINDIIIYEDFQDSIMFVATNIGVYATIDAGESWERLGESMPFIPVNDIVFNPIKKEIVAGTFGRSINTYPLDSILVNYNPKLDVRVTEENLKIDVIVYPNPTVNSVGIETGLESSKLVIYSVTGEKILEKIIGRSASLDISGLSSGQYFISITNMKSKASSVQKLIKL